MKEPSKEYSRNWCLTVLIIKTKSDRFHISYNRGRWGQHLKYSSHSDTGNEICQSNRSIKCKHGKFYRRYMHSCLFYWVKLNVWPITWYFNNFFSLFFSTSSIGVVGLNCPPRNHTGLSATGKVRPNIKLGFFWCVFLTKIKVDPECW